MQKDDLYKILGLDKNASKEDIKKAYHRLAHIHHPDKKSDDDASDYIKIREAFDTLGNEDKRKDYDHASGEEVKVNIRPRSARDKRAEGFHDDISGNFISGQDDLIERIFREFFGGTSPPRRERNSGNHIHYDDLIW